MKVEVQEEEYEKQSEGNHNLEFFLCPFQILILTGPLQCIPGWKIDVLLNQVFGLVNIGAEILARNIDKHHTC